MTTDSTYLYLLLLFEIMLFLKAWWRFDSVFFSPTIYTVFVFILSTILNIYCVDYWKIHFYPDTFWIISCGLLCVYFAETVAYINKKRTIVEVKKIMIPKPIIIVTSLFCIIGTYMYFREIQKIGMSQHMLMSEAIGNIKENFEEYENQFNPIVRQFYKLIMASAYIFTYLFVNNYVVCQEKLKSTFWLVIPFICSIAINLISGGRTDMIRMFLMFVFVYYISLWQRTGWRKKPNLKILKISIPVLVILLGIFFSARLFVKKEVSTQIQIGGPVEYFAYYVGSPIQVFNIHIHDLILHGNQNENMSLGHQTFKGLYELAINLGILNRRDVVPASVGSGMAYVGGNSNAAGNVETIFAPSHLDFSTMGMCIYIFFVYYVISYFFYRVVLYERLSIKYVSVLILFVYFFFVVELSFYDDCMKWILNQTGLLQLMILIVFIYLLQRYSKIQTLLMYGTVKNSINNSDNYFIQVNKMFMLNLLDRSDNLKNKFIKKGKALISSQF